MEYLFVYGSLCRGLSRNGLLSTAEYLGLALCEGELIDLGHYPGLIQGQGKVLGEIYRVDIPSTFDLLDQVEGYYPADPQKSLYIRKQISAQSLSTGEKLKVWTYFYHQDSPKIPSFNKDGYSDYRRYLLDRMGEKVFYVAYGSNLSLERLKERGVKHYQSVKGYLKDFRLIYNKSPLRDHEQHAYANIISGAGGKDCPCVAYEIERSGLSILDGFEGYPDHYLRTAMPVMTLENIMLSGYVYVAQPEKTVKNRTASHDYRAHILKGYQDHFLGNLSDYEYQAN
ncbi:MAG: gamma-glutamylcyclotransferase [Deltaproteobacteria bacterium]|nr:gamma-glutamylcyclotransferase [Deltaproteobacteria bacterium]